MYATSHAAGRHFVPLDFSGPVTSVIRSPARSALVQILLSCWRPVAARNVKYARVYASQVVAIFDQHADLHSKSPWPSRLDWAIQAFKQVGVAHIEARCVMLKDDANLVLEQELWNPLHTGKTMLAGGPPGKKGATTSNEGDDQLPAAYNRAHVEWEHYEESVLDATKLLHTVTMEEARYWNTLLTHPRGTNLSALTGFKNGSLIRWNGQQYTDVPGFQSPKRDDEHWLSAIECLGSAKEVAAIRTARLAREERDASQRRQSLASPSARNARTILVVGSRNSSTSSSRSNSTSSSRSSSPAGAMAGFLRRMRL